MPVARYGGGGKNEKIKWRIQILCKRMHICCSIKKHFHLNIIAKGGFMPGEIL